MSDPIKYPRFIEPQLVAELSDSPAVLIHGPRQSGKTTLAKTVGGQSGYAYFSFDDEATRQAATADPAGFVSELPEKVILDEVQHVPKLFSSLKTAIDRHRVAGRFLLTGSANVLLLPALSDSLAGRMGILRLHPLSQSELVASKPDFLDRLFSGIRGAFPTRSVGRLGPELVEKVVAGGYPSALARSSSVRRSAWYRDYVETLIQRDVRDFVRIGLLHVLPRLMAYSAGQTARLINITDLASPFQVSRTTIREYVTLLERIFLLEELQPWHSNRISRLIKTPKLHIGDSGVACSLLELDSASLIKDREMYGQLLETFVYQELRRQASWRDERVRFHHFREKGGAEVDIVMEHKAGQLAGVEVKASATVTTSDFKGLRKLKEGAGSSFTAGVVLYDGETCASFGENLFAVPIRMLWEN